MAIDIKFTKFDNTPWGFRLAGGSDFPQPLTVIRVTEGSLAECMGLQTGDVVVRLNDQPLSGLTHGRAHEALVLAGNNFVLGVLRGEDSRKAVETIREENCVPYTIPLETLPPVFPEGPKEETPEEPPREAGENATPQPLTETAEPAEEYPRKPVSADSELVANKNLTDEEIAQLILEEEELLSEQGVLGVNFKKLRPRAPFLKDSKVFEELHNIEVAEPPQLQELKRTTTFLQKPERPVPQPAKKEPDTAAQVEAYRVIIKKQQKKSVAERLIEKGLLEPGAVKTPDTRSEKTTPSTTPEPAATRESSRPASRAEETRQVTKIEEICSVEGSVATDVDCEQRSTEARIEEVEDSREDRSEEEEKEEVMSEVVPMIDKQKIKELVSTEISLEKQLENVQSQLLALKQLPSEIENHLRIVSEQLHKIMELSGVGSRRGSDEEQQKDRKDNRAREDDKERETSEDDDESRHGARDREEDHHQRRSDTDDNEERTYADRHEDGRSDVSSLHDGESTRIVESDTDHSQERKELEISVKSPTEGRSVKKFIVSYESKVIKSREPSPARSEGSFEPDPNLSPKDQVIQELQHRKGRKHSHDLWPQAKQLELTFGRRWRCPNDFFNDEMIAEVLSSQAEVLNGKAMGINFKKYEKKHLPNYDHLMNSGVYKMVHKMEHEPKRGIPVRPPKVNAAEDILERVKSPALSVEEDGDNRSARGARHLTNPQPCNRS